MCINSVIIVEALVSKLLRICSFKLVYSISKFFEKIMVTKQFILRIGKREKYCSGLMIRI